MPLPLATTTPAEPYAGGKARIAAAVDAHRDEILDLSHRIHENPEPAFEELRAAEWVADAVERHGYAVERPAGTLETVVRGILRGGLGGDRPRIGILAEYDALPGLGHGCGHNSMAASGVGAAIALAAVRDELPGEVVFLGTPAEERGSGKQFMIDDGLFDGLDAALLYHPSDKDNVEIALLASEDVEVTFTGRSSHAAADPWLGHNALDALLLLFTEIGLWRQQLRPDARVHGIVVEGGTAANIIPERAVGRFMIRSTDQAYFREMEERFAALVQAAALATATTGEAAFSGGSTSMQNNAVLLEVFTRNLRAYGVESGPVDPNLGSSDMGNVSWVVPAIHPSLAICDPGTPGHSIEFREAAASPRGDETTLLAATVVAQTAYELFRDPALVAATAADFRPKP